MGGVLHWFVPWEPSPTAVICILLAGWLYWRGTRRSPVTTSRSRQGAFWLGLVITYFCLHTQLDYYAEHEFFISRLQQFGLQHVGPFLIALAYPGAAFRRALPLHWRTRVLRPALSRGPLRWFFGFLFNPLVASLLFVGLMIFWLVPPVTFVTMLDWRLYRLMNWSMVLDGLLYWWLILDTRPRPPARLAPGVRVLVEMAVMVPQVLVGAYITFARHDLYPVFDLCGRAFGGISQATDQYMGGLIVWVPTATMSALGAMLAFRNWLRLSARGRLAIQQRWKEQRRLQAQATRQSPEALAGRTGHVA
ncbi:MAG: cytochrome c oxidase assembly protein [Rhodanobacteraceae bacterium]